MGMTPHEDIARRLREFGYPDVTGQQVTEQLNKPAGERDVVGMFAAGMLVDYGLAEPKQ
jgi:hypothetical protein